jgi:hypothetical protein
MSDNLTERNAATTLDGIRDGGQRLVFLALTALGEVRTALEEGRFDDADTRARELVSKTAALAAAEKSLGIFARTQLIRAAVLETGALVEGWGRASEVDVSQHECQSGDDPHTTVKVKFESGLERSFDGETELLVTYGSED